MPSLTVPDLDSEATLGTTAVFRSKSWNTKLGTLLGQNLEKWQGIFHALPTELHVNIMAHLHRDPVSQICFGLTSSYFYWQIFHEVRDEKEYGREGKVYPILSHPHDLRFQVSVCSQYSVFGWGEYGYLLDAWDNPTRDIAWHKSLVELLWEERWLWGNLRYCSECVKYKPESAFEEFDGQQEMMQSVSNRQEEFEFWWLGTRCKRCRAKQLFRQLGEREEVTEQRGNPWEERKSLGLKKPEYNENPEELLKQNEHSWTYSRWRDECEALNSNYETWESIFSKMCI